MATAASREVKIRISAQDDTRQEIDRAVRHVERGMNRIREIDRREQMGFLKRLKQTAGEDSSFGLTAKTLAGAGAVAGVTVSTRVLSNMTNKARELRDHFDDGEISAGEMADQMARMVPIIGDIWQAGRNIREMFTREEYLARRITEHAEKLNTVLEHRRRIAMSMAAEQRRNAELSRSFRDEAALIGLDPDQSSLVRMEQMQQKRREAIEERIKGMTDAAAELEKKRGEVAAEIGKRQANIDRGNASVRAQTRAEISELEAQMKALTRDIEQARKSADVERRKLMRDATELALREERHAFREISQRRRQEMEREEEERKRITERELEIRERALEQMKRDAEHRRGQLADAIESAAMSRMGFRFTHSGGVAEALETGSLTGVAASARRRAADDPVFQQQTEQLKAQKEIAKMVTAIHTTLVQQGQIVL